MSASSILKNPVLLIPLTIGSICLMITMVFVWWAFWNHRSRGFILGSTMNQWCKSDIMCPDGEDGEEENKAANWRVFNKGIFEEDTPVYVDPRTGCKCVGGESNCVKVPIGSVGQGGYDITDCGGIAGSNDPINQILINADSV